MSVFRLPDSCEKSEALATAGLTPPGADSPNTPRAPQFSKPPSSWFPTPRLGEVASLSVNVQKMELCWVGQGLDGACFIKAGKPMD